MHVLRFLDVVAVVVAAIPAIALGAPAFGYLVGGGAWIAQRVLQQYESRLIGTRVTDSVRRAGTRLFAAFGRIWLLAAGIVIAAAVGQRKDGLTATLVIFAAYSVAFVIRLVSGPPPPSREAR